jgi:hypothetical protein
MMCGRSETPEDIAPVAAVDEDGEVAAPDETAQLSAQIASRRLESFADGYLERLKAEARIIEY